MLNFYQSFNLYRRFRMSKNTSVLDWIDTQHQSMVDLVTRWAKINTHTFNLTGLSELSKDIQWNMQVLQGKMETLNLPGMEFVNSRGEIEERPLGAAIKMTKRPEAPKQVLLVCHMDTVYHPDTAAKSAVELEDGFLRGPGATDAKGGIVVMLKALEAIERSSVKNNLGWAVFLNSDEEVGSPGSKQFLQELAPKSQIGLVFEPCLPNGNLVGERKGSGNFTLIVRGRSAHAGRDLHLGRNAIDVLAKCIIKINSLTNTRHGLTVNIGLIEGGQALNVVPDMAIARFNIRLEKAEDEAHVWVDLKQIIVEMEKIDGIYVKLHGGFSSPPKVFDAKTSNLFHHAKACAQELGFDLDWQASGGVCDGNRLAAAGLPNIDTLGPRGGNIHSSNEFLAVESLTQRTKLAALFLMKIAEGEIKI